jgi:ABC-2 type transport system ATP-binding protein
VGTLQISHIHKWFGKQHVVAGLSFELKVGMVLGLLGPNGAGKTTTIRMLTGLLSPSEGHVLATIEGKSFSPVDLAFRRYVGYCPEQAPLYPEMTVFRYLYTVCRLRGVGRSLRQAAIATVLQSLDLMTLADREISVLSKGQRQRVNIAQSLVHDPLIWILDEPLAGLDPEQVTLVRELIVAKGKTKAVLISSHLLSEMTQMSTDILILKQGVSLLSESLDTVMVGASPLFLTLCVAPDVAMPVFAENFPSVASVFLMENEGIYRYKFLSETDIRETLFYLCCRNNWPIYGLEMLQKPLEERYLEVIR